ncbi:MAG TPA: hypothetical protein DFS52_09995 [Myxococcales bacterium]|nr:hypothetical protein [Myxococcales bacterium]
MDDLTKAAAKGANGTIEAAVKWKDGEFEIDPSIEGAAKGAAIGAAIAGGPGAVIGAILGGIFGPGSPK